MSKKLNRTEIATLAKRILEEVNEVNQKYNDTKKLDPAYIAEIQRIKAQDPLQPIIDQFEKELKIKFGTDYKKEIDFSLTSNWGSKSRKLEEDIENELKKYAKTHLKHIYVQGEYGSNYSKKIEQIIDDITIAQIDITDVQMLINTIKSKLL